MKSNRGSISIFMLLIIPILAIGIFILYDYFRTYQMENQVLKNTRNLSEIQLSNNNAHLFDYYGILAYLDQDIIKNQIIALNSQVTVSHIEVDHFNMGSPNHFIHATKTASRNIIALEAVNQIRGLIDPYLQTENSGDLIWQIKQFEKKVEIFFDFHSALKNIEKLKASWNTESILKSIENDVSSKYKEVVNSYETLLESETDAIQSQVHKYESLMKESVRISVEWEEKISDLRQVDQKIERLRQELINLKTEMDRKTVELETVSESEIERDALLKELSSLNTQKMDCDYDLSLLEEKWTASIDQIIADHKYSKPKLLNRIAQLSNKIDEMLFDIEPVENLALPSDGLDLEQLDATTSSEINMMDKMIYAEYWMGVLKSFDKGSVRNFNPLGTKVDRESVINGEVEYLLAGKLTDPQNVQVIKMRIFAMRTVANMIHIASDATKTAQIGRVTATLPVPWNTIAYGAMVTLWSSAEGYLDVIALFKGEGHHFIKNENEWKLSFDHLMQESLTTVTDKNVIKNDLPQNSKLYYQDYLRLMLYIQSFEITAKRGMLLLDANIRKASENRFNLTWFSIGHRIEMSYRMNGLDETNSVMSMVNQY